MTKNYPRWSIFWFLLLSVSMVAAGPAPVDPIDLTEISLEDLMNIEITSVARKEQAVSDAAAAVFVITREDIRRSGITAIPELLRMVPGLHVAQIDASSWAISARGFNSQFANKMLVLIDGRTVYSPMFAGVFWEAQDLLLEDIQRIEVIRGPGATLWGANAVNGVINIITARSVESDGTLFAATLGADEQPIAAVSHAGQFGTRGSYRVYGKFQSMQEFAPATGSFASDAWDAARAGMRIDFDLGQGGTLMLQGDGHSGTADHMFSLPILAAPYLQLLDGETEFSGSSLLTRWVRGHDGSETSLQFYYDRSRRSELGNRYRLQTLDVDFQHRMSLGRNHELLWGAGYRRNADDMTDSFDVSFDPDKRSYDLFSAFVQADTQLSEGRLRLTLGTKFERNDFTGTEIQPNLRLLWKMTSRNSIWAAVSRAVRSPARVFEDVSVNVAAFPDPTSGLTALVVLNGNDDVESEDVVALEVGYRTALARGLSLELDGFYNEYRNLSTTESGLPFVEPGPVPYIVIPQSFDNLGRGQAHGLEAVINWRPAARWSLQGSYALFDLDLDLEAASNDPVATNVNDPKHQVRVRTNFDLTDSISVNSSLYFVDDIPVQNISSYTRLDLHLSMQRNEWEFSVGGRNLLDSRHAEFVDVRIVPTEVERSYYGRFAWRF